MQAYLHCVHALYHCFCLIIAGHFVIAYFYLLAVVDGSLGLHVIIYFVYYLRCLLLGSEFDVLVAVFGGMQFPLFIIALRPA